MGGSLSKSEKRVKVLHIGTKTSFIPGFFQFLEDNMDVEGHRLLVQNSHHTTPKVLQKFIVEKTALAYLTTFTRLARQVDKIILHSLSHPLVLVSLFLQPKLLAKCYWFIWGGDLYAYQLQKKDVKARLFEILRRRVIRRLGHLVTYVEGDVDLARNWYGAAGRYHECLMYPSNVYRYNDTAWGSHPAINVLVGNSADPSNNHLEIFDKLIHWKNNKIKIYVPLSYGDTKNAEIVTGKGYELFGDDFVPILEPMPLDQYSKFLNSIDIAIFNHKRQQGMGNAITLLGLGKMLYMRKEVTSWSLFKELGITVFDVDGLSDVVPHAVTLESNAARVKEYFSSENLASQLRNIFMCQEA